MSKDKALLVTLPAPAQKWYPMKSAMTSFSVRSIALAQICVVDKK